ncbi:hypothetical protein J7E92_33060 [Streptomyces sp. ISL-63]|uniref:hypothetical protein n=1 Tax=Streptomyces sp. ISL-63 TaxID=2819185 RepID=UPI001BE8EB7A|nr:hypothetical protein [Streptomyces sp. ISL-63]MBT2466251.1 hypothetical protein [Streptomyces sp. ISL-63]
MEPVLPTPEQAVDVSEHPRYFVITLQGDVENPEVVRELEQALQAGQDWGKQIVVDLSGVGLFSGDVLNALLAPARRGGSLPWLTGPLSRNTLHRLELTGTAPHFQVFPTLLDATGQS